ncbi:hypothetical protein [Chryseobacterium sp. HSC-36S06]|uniref:hypothetical protein n=1 Tax=Chryseobacterium sp. HSC-36S06 TaxID=2910970 RepID=UPI0020A0EEA0|nr:hypothetical protein [Chryseobacterium sp. HSC-36S06]MCP2037331.1 putative solute-binding protein [Chryseobacterium sp. HSC-36S06]
MRKVILISSLLFAVYACKKNITPEEMKERAEYRKKQTLEREEMEKRTAKAMRFLYWLEESDSLLHEDIYQIIGDEAIESYKLGDRD